MALQTNRSEFYVDLGKLFAQLQMVKRLFKSCCAGCDRVKGGTDSETVHHRWEGRSLLLHTTVTHRVGTAAAGCWPELHHTLKPKAQMPDLQVPRHSLEEVEGWLPKHAYLEPVEGTL